MTQNENSNAQDWGFLKFDPIVLVRDVARRWALILLAVLVAVGVLIGTLMDRGGWAAVKDFFASIFQKR